MPEQLTFTMASDLNGRNTHTDIHPTETVVTNVKRKNNRKVQYTHLHTGRDEFLTLGGGTYVP